jgi:SAM-dependent methyltransferase
MPNYFDPEWVARRYAATRPDVHSEVVTYLRDLLALQTPLSAALDVGCGTGLSTRPLCAIAERVVGLDPAPFMLQEARRAGGASYIRGNAEDLPFGRDRFDLLSIGCAYHWCETEAFLGEALRVIQASGHLVIYDNCYFADSPHSSALLDWLSSEYWPRLPHTPRNPLPEPGAFDHESFELVEGAFIETWVRMSRQELLVYLTTQSGAVAAVESGEQALEGIESLLFSGLSSLMPEEGGEFRFGGPVWVVRPIRS